MMADEELDSGQQDAAQREHERTAQRNRALDAPCATCGHGYGVHALNGCHRCGQDECSGFLGKFEQTQADRRALAEVAPDWGHGPNTPQPYWTEDDLREAMHAVMHTFGDLAKIEAVIARLKGSS